MSSATHRSTGWSSGVDPALYGVIVHTRPLNWTFYRPVELLMDRTPLGEPLFCWADLWGCGATVRRDSMFREISRAWAP
jgi:hypothetical protein